MNTKRRPDITLADLRQMSGGVKQSVIALQMHVQEPAISKLEKKLVSEISVDKLKKFIDAIGGTVSLTIELPDGTQINDFT